jgi:hypothetical protein
MRNYAEDSTLWLLGQYLGWVEILRRGAQFLDFGTRKRNRALQQALGKIAGELATDVRGRRFAVFRTVQRGIGELMIAEVDEKDASKRSSTLGYAEFVQRLHEADFARWFARLQKELETIKTERDYQRLIRVQRALVDLIDELDPDRVLYPVLDMRGKLPLPPQASASVVLDGYDLLARFVVRASEYDVQEEDFPQCFLADWAVKNRLDEASPGDQPDSWRYEGRPRPFSAHLVLQAVYRRSRLEIYAAAVSPSWARLLGLSGPSLPLAAGGWQFRRSRRRERETANDLLRRFDRPPVR